MNPRVNAVVQVDDERALARARGLTPSSRAAAVGLLRGVPFTVKDNLEAAGIEMTIGAPERVGVIAQQDAVVVARMRAAGAILLGKTNCPTYGGGIETDNQVYGRTNNPYDLERTPGRQLGRRGGGDRGGLLAVRVRDRLGRERAAARPLLRDRRAEADRRAGARRRRARRPRPDRRARRPAHPGRHARPLRRGRGARCWRSRRVEEVPGPRCAGCASRCTPTTGTAADARDGAGRGATRSRPPARGSSTPRTPAAATS